MQAYPIRDVAEADLAALERALSALALDLGDPYRADLDSLARALFATPQTAWARIADGPSGPAGITLFSPVFSTVRGGAGVYVSDLWVDSAARGKGLGPALLHSAAETAAQLWDARFLRLAVYPGNTHARAVYDKLGFEQVGAETGMVLTGQAFQNRRGQR